MQEVLLFSLGHHRILYPVLSVSSVLGLNMNITLSDSLFWGRGVLMLLRLVPNLGFKNSTAWRSVQLNYKQTSSCSHHWALENPVTWNKVLRALFYLVISCWKMIRWWKKCRSSYHIPHRVLCLHEFWKVILFYQHHSPLLEKEVVLVLIWLHWC